MRWGRVGSQCMVAILVVLAGAQLYLQSRGAYYGFDFRGGIWQAGGAVLAGRSPFPPAQAAVLLAQANGFITPPPLALLGALFSWLPFGWAIIAFNLICVGALIGALDLLGVRGPYCWIVVLCSFPFVSSLALAQPDGLFALAAAVAWSAREHGRGAVAVGVLIAAKLLAWPLIIWLLVTRRFRQAALALGSGIALLMVSWACIGFRGIASYTQLLGADARAFETHAHSFVTALAGSGVPVGIAMPLSVAMALLLAAAIVAVSRRGDLGWFTAALTLGVLASPVVWQHYLVLLFIPLAVAGGLGDPLVWLLTLGLWISPAESPATLAQAWLIPLLASALSLRCAVLSRRTRSAARVNQSAGSSTSTGISRSVLVW